MKSWKYVSHPCLSLVAAFFVAACGSAPLSLPTQVGKYETKLELKAKAKVVVKATTANCDSVRAAAKFEVQPLKGAAAGMKDSCEGSRFVAVSDFLAPGSYTLRLSLRKHSLKALAPVVTLELANPDYKSGPDQYAEGALPMEAGKGIESKVHYTEGDTNDWLRAAGEKKRVYLTFVPQDDTKVTAAIYRVLPGGRPSKLQNLPVGRPASVYLGKDDVLVKVTASNEDGETSYTVLRRDEDAKKSVTLQVVDAYPTGSASSIVLLRPNAAVKADDELRISAKTEAGNWKELGACRVSSVTAEGIQCELGGAWSERFTDYKATGTAPVSG